MPRKPADRSWVKLANGISVLAENTSRGPLLSIFKGNARIAQVPLAPGIVLDEISRSSVQPFVPSSLHSRRDQRRLAALWSKVNPSSPFFQKEPNEQNPNPIHPLCPDTLPDACRICPEHPPESAKICPAGSCRVGQDLRR